MEGNQRRCNRCREPFHPDKRPVVYSSLSPQTVSMRITAWVHGFCSTECMTSSALDQVADRTAWWYER